MDLERALLAKVLRMKSGMRKAMENKITDEYFTDDSAKRAWQWCVNYWKEYGERPTEEAFKEDYAGFRLPNVEEPFDFVIEQLKERRRRNMLNEAIGRAADLIDTEEPVGSPSKQAVALLRDILRDVEIETSNGRDTNLATTVNERLEAYREMEKNKGRLLGLPTGYPSLDFASGGLQPEQLITLVGLSKAGKSIVLMNMGMEAYSVGAEVLMFTFEMSGREQGLRFDGMSASLNYRKIMDGNLSRKDWENLSKHMRSWSNLGDFIISSDTTGGMTVSAIAAKAQQYHPDIILVDGVYMMDSDDRRHQKGSSQALTDITRSLKRLAQRLRIPIVVTTQALAWKQGPKSKGLSSEAIGYTSSFVQDSDLVVVMFHEEDRKDVAKLRITENRMGPRGEFTIHFDFNTMNFAQVDEGLSEIPIEGDGESSGSF